MSRWLIFIYRCLTAISEPRKLTGLLRIPRFIFHWRQFASRSEQPLHMVDAYPCLSDWSPSTPFDPHYFFQAAWLARRLAVSSPSKHFDVGSDVRMIGVLSAFVPIEFIDFRPLAVSLEGLICSAGNITSLDRQTESLASLSCMHVIEHIGLGRYGDPIDPSGSARGLHELQRTLAPGGRLYLSVPVGRERICFNAHRVFDPQTIVDLLAGLRLVEFSLVDDAGVFHERQSLSSAAGLEYGCGLFILEKV